MLLIFHVLIYILWRISLLVYNAVRGIIWRLSGVQRRIYHLQRNRLYPGSVHVQRIVFRHTFDQHLSPVQENVFLTVHDAFVDPDYVLRDDVTLSHINEKRVVFVQSNKNIFDPKNGSFSNTAQFVCAERILIMPIRCFHQLSRTLPDPDKLIFINMAPRSGSTLISHVFQEAAGCRSWSEPDIEKCLWQMYSCMDEDEFIDFLRHTVRFLCKPSTSGFQPEGHVIKFGYPHAPTCMFPIIQEVFPNVKFLFTYRNLHPSVQSLGRVYSSSPKSNLMLRISLITLSCPLTRWISAKFMSPPEKEFAPLDFRVNTFGDAGTWIMLYTFRKYISFLASGLPIVATKYEDLELDSIETCSRIVKEFGLSLDVKKAEKVLSVDAQKVSPISSTHFDKTYWMRQMEINPRVLDQMLKHFQLSINVENIRLPNTITRPLSN